MDDAQKIRPRRVVIDVKELLRRGRRPKRLKAQVAECILEKQMARAEAERERRGDDG